MEPCEWWELDNGEQLVPMRHPSNRREIYPKTGSTGDGMASAKVRGHTLYHLQQVPLTSGEEFIKKGEFSDAVASMRRLVSLNGKASVVTHHMI